MSKLDMLPERALDLATQAGDALREFAPRATNWLDTGAKIGALKGGAKIGMKVLRRNPVVFAAAAAGAGLLWYAAKRRARKAETTGKGQTLEGSARRVEARSAKATRAPRRAATRRATSRTRTTTEPRTEH